MTDFADVAVPSHLIDTLPCWSYYATRRLSADPATPIDRWAQGNQTRDLREVVENISPLVRAYGATTLVEPFTGMGSAGLAARYLGMSYLGTEISRSRALRAQAKAFLTHDLLETFVEQAGGEREIFASVIAAGRPGDAAVSGDADGAEGHSAWVGPAVLETLAGLTARNGSAAAALDTMRRDLAGAPDPRPGRIQHGDFRDLKPDREQDAPAVFNLCPPFPRVEKTGSSPTGADGAVYCQTPALFETLATDLARWLGDQVAEQDVVVCEYVNALPRYDAGTRLADLLAAELGYVRIVPAAAENQRGTVVKHPTGHCGFLLASRRGLVDVPTEWSGVARADVGHQARSA